MTAATCRGCGGPTKDTFVYCDDCYRKGGRTDSAAWRDDKPTSGSWRGSEPPHLGSPCGSAAQDRLPSATFCGDEQPHERHEFIDGALRFDCPGTSAWHSGLCAGMSGCAWAQRGREPATWRHFGTLAEAEAYADERNELAPDPHYSCGAAYCDDPACTIHNVRHPNHAD